MPNPNPFDLPSTAENAFIYFEDRSMKVAEKVAKLVTSSLSIFSHRKGTWTSPPVITLSTAEPDPDAPQPISKRFFLHTGYEPIKSLELLSICRRLIQLTEPMLTATDVITRIVSAMDAGHLSVSVTENYAPGVPSTPFTGTGIDEWPHFWAQSQNVVRWQPTPSVVVTFVIDFTHTTVATYAVWNNPRKPRKWGRSLTERWKEEHAQLVAHRKFNRNQKKVEADSMALRKPADKQQKKRTPAVERDLLNSILNRGEMSAKRAALSAAKSAKTATRKHIEKKGAQRVLSAVAKKLKRFGHGPAESTRPKKKKPAATRRRR